MSRSEYRTVVKALITYQGQVLIGQKEEGDQPHSGEWHFLGGHLEDDESLEEAVAREVEEETGLSVDVHQIIDAMVFSWKKDGRTDSLQLLYHCEARSPEAEARDDLQDVKWVDPDELEDELWDEEVKRIENRDERAKFVEKLKKMPSRGGV
ncbi:MAG: NUDIX hydrolase [Candidatus Nanohaloarchaea archaeon]